MDTAEGRLAVLVAFFEIPAVVLVARLTQVGGGARYLSIRGCVVAFKVGHGAHFGPGGGLGLLHRADLDPPIFFVAHCGRFGLRIQVPGKGWYRPAVSTAAVPPLPPPPRLFARPRRSDVCWSLRLCSKSSRISRSSSSHCSSPRRLRPSPWIGDISRIARAPSRSSAISNPYHLDRSMLKKSLSSLSTPISPEGSPSLPLVRIGYITVDRVATRVTTDAAKRRQRLPVVMVGIAERVCDDEVRCDKLHMFLSIVYQPTSNEAL